MLSTNQIKKIKYFLFMTVRWGEIDKIDPAGIPYKIETKKYLKFFDLIRVELKKCQSRMRNRKKLTRK
jgi:hypothetical protein